MSKRSAIARDLRSPKYRPRIIPNRKKALSRKASKKPMPKDVEEAYDRFFGL